MNNESVVCMNKTDKTKRSKGKILKAASFMMALVLLLSLISFDTDAHATANNDATRVNVAFPIVKSMSELDYLGNPKGYIYQYLQELSMYSSFDYKYYMENYDRCIEKLKTGELDLIGYVEKSDEKAQFLDYTSLPAGTLECMLVADEYSSRFLYNDYETLQNSRVGMLRNNIYSGKLRKLQEEKGVNLTIYEYDSESTLKLDLSLGKIDCALVSNYENLSGYRMIFDLGKIPFYFAVSKNSPRHDKIYNKIDKAMTVLLKTNPNFNDKIALGYKEAKPSQIVNLTPEEEEYVKKNRIIKVGYSLDWIPMSFYDFINHRKQGFIFEMLKEVSHDTGIEFQYMAYDSYSKSMKALEKGEVDMVAGCDRELAYGGSKNIVLTHPYINMKTVAVYNPKAYELPVAVPDPYASTYKIKSTSIGKTVTTYKTVDECLEKVNDGEASYTYLNKYAYEVYKNTNSYPNLVQDLNFNQSRQLCIGINKSKSELAPILNKAVASFSTEEIENLLMTSAMKAEDSSIVTGLKKHPTLIIAMEILIGMLIIAMALFYRVYMRRREWRLNYNEISGVWNYTRFQNVVNARLRKERVEDYKNNLALVHIDIAKFKYINDIYGFKIGDKVLYTTGRILKENLSIDEFIGSLWADHFVMIMEVGDLDELEYRLDKIFSDIAEDIFVRLDYNINFRAGAYVIKKADLIIQMPVVDLMKHANYALGTISENYKTNFVCYDESMAGDIENTSLIYKDMMMALRTGKFTPYYQAKYDIVTGKLIGVEVLVRWVHGIHGVISPSVFVPHLEKTGFIVELDFQMFEVACKNLQHWINQNFDDIIISTNFSRRHLKDKKFVRKLTEISDRFQIPRSKLEIEITESMGEYGKELVESRIKELRKVGYRVSIDDFGSGYSAISLLQSIYVDVIKLDGQFLLATDMVSNNYKVMEAIVRLSHELGMEVICEGVETEEHVEVLKNVGCRYAQGYYYSKPIPFEEFVELMKRDS